MVKLFVVGFPRDFNELKLVELFSVHGTVQDVKIIKDQQTRVSKGYGFITMDDQPGAERAIAAMNGVSAEGRTISVRIADNKSEGAPERSSPAAGKGETAQRYDKPGNGPRPKRPRK